MINYKTLKSASKVSLSKTNDGLYYITKKNYNTDTGAEENDSISRVIIADIDARISIISTQSTELTNEKADLEQLKTDLEAL
mgnify:FL=1|tara:strand:+ start:84 stop:329 length:246 start_codon:yes stop_codon:yes gene_type:complete